MPASNIAVRLHVYGVVQGVGFRYSTVLAARRLGVVGWVRNRHDGSVEIHAEGSQTALDALHAWAKQGPRHARVDRVTIDDTTPEQHVEFSEYPTL